MELKESHARVGGRIIRARGVKDIRIIQPTESTKQGSWEFTDTEAAILGHCSVLKTSSCYDFLACGFVGLLTVYRGLTVLSVLETHFLLQGCLAHLELGKMEGEAMIWLYCI